MNVLLAIGVVVFCFEFPLASGGRGSSGRRGGGSGSSSGSGRGGRVAMWERLKTLENTVDILAGEVKNAAELIKRLTKKEGECPKPPPDVFGICAELCGHDMCCPDDQKCCSNGCGHVCMKPAGSTEKEGVCPSKPPDTIADGTCIRGCGNDIQCPDDLKCCNYGCSNVCMKPEAPSGHCPPGREEIQGSYCGRGGSRCGSGYYCEIAHNDAYAVCCSGCPPDKPEVKCFADPCEGAVCNAYPNTAKCTANYCGGCNAVWTVGNEEVNCDLKGK